MITAKLNDYRQSPRKVRLVTNLVKGKSVENAINALTILDKRAADPLKQLIESAVANAKNNFNLERDVLFVKEFRVDAGEIMYRRMPRARGTAFPIRKRTSRVSLVLAAKELAAVKKPVAKIAKEAKVKKVAKK
jgi:large subunit ribosomal protein L22